jgi:hypothetical protein
MSEPFAERRPRIRRIWHDGLVELVAAEDDATADRREAGEVEALVELLDVWAA